MNDLYTGFDLSTELTWSSVSHLKAIGEVLHCMDARRHNCVVGAPGGNLGESLLILASAETVHGQHYKPRFLRWYIHRSSDSLGRFYLHTDNQTLQSLIDALEHDEQLASWTSAYATPEAFFQGLLNPPRELQSALLAYLVKPQYVGCDSLRLFLENREQLNMRPKLIEDTLASFYILLWGHHPAMTLELLEANQSQTAFVCINSDEDIQDQTPIPYTCNHELYSVFVDHGPVRQLYQHQSIQILAELESAFGRAPCDENQLKLAIEAAGKQHLALIQNRLAPDLPVYQYKINQGQLMAQQAKITESPEN